jgi:hypothetical protein
VHPDHAALTAVGSGLDQLLERVTSLAESHRDEADETLVGDLYELERALRATRRLLDRVLRGR